MSLISPPLLLAALLGSLIGLAFYFLFGGRGERLLNCWALGVAGFLLGHLAGTPYSLSKLRIGDVHVVEGTLGSVLVLLVAHLLARQTAKRK